MSCWRSQPLTCNILREQQQGAARRSWTCTTFTLPRAGIAHPWPLFSPCAALHRTGATLCELGAEVIFQWDQLPAQVPVKAYKYPGCPACQCGKEWRGQAGGRAGGQRDLYKLLEALHSRCTVLASAALVQSVWFY